MSIQILTKTQFDQKVKGLPCLLRPDISAEVVFIEEVDAEYFRNDQRHRCIVKRKDGNLYLSYYD